MAVRLLLPLLAVCLLGTARAQEGIRWQHDLAAAQQQAADTQRLVLLHFWATWCEPCKKVDRGLFSMPMVAQAIEANYVPVKLDYDANRSLAQQYNVRTLPCDVVLKPSGEVLAQFNTPADPDTYLGRMGQIAASARPATPGMYASAGRPAGDPSTEPRIAASGPWTGSTAAPPTNAVATGSDPRYGWSDQRYANHPAGNPPVGSTPPSDYRQQPRMDSVAPPYAQQVNPPAGAPGNTPAAGIPASVGSAGLPGAIGMSGEVPLPNGNQPAVGSTNPSDYPPAAPPTQQFAMDGYCPVHLTERQEWAKGDLRWGAVHRGKTYLFASPQCQQKFLANPDKYSPAISGNDPVLLVERGLSVPGRREHGCFFGTEPNRRVILFADEASFQAFERDPQRYASAVYQAPTSR